MWASSKSCLIQSIYRCCCRTLLLWTRALNNVKEGQQIWLNPGITKWDHCKEDCSIHKGIFLYICITSFILWWWSTVWSQFFFHHNQKWYIIISGYVCAPALVQNATMPSEAVACTVWNVICDGIPLSGFTLWVRQVFSLDMKASGDACQSWSPMMMAWGEKTASVVLTWKLWVSALLWCDNRHSDV